MCGLVALHRYNDGPPLDIDELFSIRDAMVKRGPDGSGVWTSASNDVAIGHRRLSIIGLGHQGTQPMTLEKRCLGGPGMLVVSFNGEIFNHASLRRDLTSRGHMFQSACDTEVLLHLYEEHAERMTHYLRGMYAFVIWDSDRHRLLLARDPYGIKPLFFSDDGTTVRAASQVQALLRGGGVVHRTNDAALAGFLLFGHIPDPLTFSAKIDSLPAGSFLSVEHGRVTGPVHFYSLPQALRESVERHGGRDDKNELREAVMDSVAAHLVADVEVGVFLSAGIDSATLLAASAELRGEMSAVTVSFDHYADTSDDEERVALQIAARYGAKHTVAHISGEDLRDASDSFLLAMDQPSIDGVNTWLVSRAARDIGLKVALSGLGGDELFGGYDTFKSVPKWAARLKWPAAIPGMGRSARAVLRRLIPDRYSPKHAGILEYGRSLEEVWFVRRALFMPWELPALLGEERALTALNDLNLRRQLTSQTRPDPGSDFGRVAALEAGLYMRNQLLRDTDWASMDHSLEVRVPLVDPVLLARVAPILARSWNPSNGKLPLAMTAKVPLPDSVLYRKKTGFSVPLGLWLDKNDAHSSWQRIQILRRKGCSWSRRWAYSVAEHFGLLAA